MSPAPLLPCYCSFACAASLQLPAPSPPTPRSSFGKEHIEASRRLQRSLPSSVFEVPGILNEFTYSFILVLFIEAIHAHFQNPKYMSQKINRNNQCQLFGI